MLLGVQVSRYFDVINSKIIPHGTSGYIIIFKLIKVYY